MTRCSTPTLARPISPQQFMREFKVLWERAPRWIPARPHPSFMFTEAMFRTHEETCRRYAEVDVLHRVFHWAPQVLTLRAPQRLGLLAHEIGHVLMGLSPHTEEDADCAAFDDLSVVVTYDKRWGGKGLQTGRFVFL